MTDKKKKSYEWYEDAPVDIRTRKDGIADSPGGHHLRPIPDAHRLRGRVSQIEKLHARSGRRNACRPRVI